MNFKNIYNVCSGPTLGEIRSLDLALLLVRMGVSFVFITHGWSKLGNMEGTIGFFATLGFSSTLAYIVAYVEFLGGIAFLVGIFSRLVGGLFVIIMAVAIFTVHLKNGYSGQGGYEFQLLLLLASLALALTGSGRFSLHDRFFSKW